MFLDFRRGLNEHLVEGGTIYLELETKNARDVWKISRSELRKSTFFNLLLSNRILVVKRKLEKGFTQKLNIFTVFFNAYSAKRSNCSIFSQQKNLHSNYVKKFTYRDL